MKSTSKIAGFIAATAALSMLVTASASAEERHRDGTSRDHSSYRDSVRSNDANRNSGSTRNETRNNTYRNNDSRNNSSRNESRSNAYRNESRSNTNRNESRSNGYRNESRSNGYRNETRSNGYRNEGRNNHISEHGRISRFTRERDGYRVWLGGARSYWIPSYRLGGRRLSIGLDLRLGGIFNGTYVDVDALGWPGDPYYNDPYYAPAPYYNDRYLSGRVERVDYRSGTLLLRDERSGRAVEVDMRATDRRGGVDFDDLRPGDRVTLDGTWDRGYFHAYRIDGVRSY